MRARERGVLHDYSSISQAIMPSCAFESCPPDALTWSIPADVCSKQGACRQAQRPSLRGEAVYFAATAAYGKVGDGLQVLTPVGVRYDVSDR